MVEDGGPGEWSQRYSDADSEPKDRAGQTHAQTNWNQGELMWVTGVERQRGVEGEDEIPGIARGHVGKR